ncbi:GntR family transcriptional regulator, phosphonate transport system regulatory protein [Thalassococcus halodurans]|uniref:GntR family transcriptional regulator, phosphonate transport system regulatory protein n=1 Tax=Thalassococcus halodurans TaxID=373675 RepID=A0A1H6B1V6_9RHOB|nr:MULTISPECIES: phosphonate metabolism transcriptional regulator PhnF [Thalassococcus]MBO6868777.1 phosphonate metabolism transcriptional regulator PhnF [Thalassococcus sp.]MEE2810957.1 phosphonate metabolism transcriptional regulator PhnF [Pseudomonadota bacterium]SEG54295.1 GntR family transcriptional regulator, phosphonate transport system regulatory protein [Thalassococcus halodurans]
MRKTPIWKAIADALREDISERRYGEGGKLPTEAALAERFGVNRHTVRHGIAALVDEGLLRSRRGSGVFVSARPTDYPLGKRVRFHENLIAAGRSPLRKLLHLETRFATEGEAIALDIAQGDPVCAYHGLSFADEQPIALFESLFPLERLPEIETALRTINSVTKALTHVGVEDYTRASTRLTAVRATPTQALHLNLIEGDPLLKSTSVNVDAQGRPVEYGRTYFAGDRVTLTLEN